MARLTPELPSGWSMDGEGFADKCSGICIASYEIAPGDQRYIEISAYPNYTGDFQLKGRVDFTYKGAKEIHFVAPGVRINVTPAQATPVVILATQAPAIPTAQLPIARPTAIIVTQAPAGGSGGQSPEAGGGYGYGAEQPDAAGVVDSGLLLAGLLLPAGILVRLGIGRRRDGRDGGG